MTELVTRRESRSPAETPAAGGTRAPDGRRAQRDTHASWSAPAGRDPASYRDPSGFVYRRGGTLYRQVNARFAEQWAAVRASGLLEALWTSRRLVPHEAVSLDFALTDDAVAVLRPTELPVISYAAEWTFSQLRDAALTTLEIQRLALQRGVTLRDALASNIQFDGPRPVHIDTARGSPTASRTSTAGCWRRSTTWWRRTRPP